ncbi:MAG: hypothetical protein ACXAC7_15460 [Candidatus Hodarchaeales archaeon]|jgi:hypothetical protein
MSKNCDKCGEGLSFSKYLGFYCNNCGQGKKSTPTQNNSQTILQTNEVALPTRQERDNVRFDKISFSDIKTFTVFGREDPILYFLFGIGCSRLIIIYMNFFSLITGRNMNIWYIPSFLFFFNFYISFNNDVSWIIWS